MTDLTYNDLAGKDLEPADEAPLEPGDEVVVAYPEGDADTGIVVTVSPDAVWVRVGERDIICDPDSVGRLEPAPWSTSTGCPDDCDRTYSGSGHLGGWSSDHNGRCKHGTYVAGSGIDWMCGYCENGD